MAYVTYSSQAGRILESLGVIDLDTQTSKEYAREPVSSTASSNASFFGNMRWVNATQFATGVGQDNYLFDTTRVAAHNMGTTYGSLIGIADGRR